MERHVASPPLEAAKPPVWWLSDKAWAWGTVAYVGSVATVAVVRWLGFDELHGLNEWGDYVGGWTAPVVFAWLIRGYRLQTEELRLQRQELHETREELRRTADSQAATEMHQRRQVYIDVRGMVKESLDRLCHQMRVALKNQVWSNKHLHFESNATSLTSAIRSVLRSGMWPDDQERLVSAAKSEGGVAQSFREYAEYFEFWLVEASKCDELGVFLASVRGTDYFSLYSLICELSDREAHRLAG